MNSAIYLRVSTNEQNPENQLKDCNDLSLRLGLNNPKIYQEHVSAFKDNVERPVFNELLKEIKDGNINILIVWDFDRLFRNRKKTVEFIRNYSKLGLKVYSYRQQWFESINKMPEPWNEMVFDLMLQVVSWMAEEESKKKSERVKAAVRIKPHTATLSYKGNKWGRPELNNKVITQIIDLRSKGLSIRQITKEVFYWDHNKNKKQVSVAAVHKILKQNYT